MKSCPKCNRTYSDGLATFCLVDGSPLSAPQVPDVESQSANARPDRKSNNFQWLIKRILRGIIIGAPAGLVILPIIDLTVYDGRGVENAALAGIFYGAIFGVLVWLVLIPLIKYAWK